MFNKLKELFLKNEDNQNLGCPQCQGLCGNYQPVKETSSATVKGVSAIPNGSTNNEQIILHQDKDVSDVAMQSENSNEIKNYHEDASKDSQWNWLYKRHKTIIQRCKSSNPIDESMFVCEEWLAYENFKSWALKNGCNKYSKLCRHDTNVGFSPENCFWKSTIRMIDCSGLAGSASDWSKITGLPERIIIRRFKSGKSVESSLYSDGFITIAKMYLNHLDIQADEEDRDFENE